jgi:hypothetical protein
MGGRVSGRATWVIAASSVLVLWSCGGDDGASTVATEPSEVATSEAATATRLGGGGASTSTESPGPTSVGPPSSGALPDACTLLDQGSVDAALGISGATAESPQKPNEASSRCEWTGPTPYTLSLLVRQGSSIKSSFDNTTSSGFGTAVLDGADASVRLGAIETARKYRLVSFAALTDTYYVYLSLQGPDREDGPATAAAAVLAGEVLAALPG